MKEFRDKSRANHAGRLDAIRRAEGGRVNEPKMAEEAREAAAKTMRSRRDMPGAFPLGGEDPYSQDVDTISRKRLDRPSRASGGRVQDEGVALKTMRGPLKEYLPKEYLPEDNYRKESPPEADFKAGPTPEIRSKQRGREVQPTDLYTDEQIKRMEGQFKGPPDLPATSRAKGGKVSPKKD